MRSRFAALAAITLAACSAAGIWLSAAETRKPNENDAPVIKQLLDRVAKLEARVAQLEQRQPKIVVPYSQPLQRVPKDWERREFNGQTYFIVPLDTSRAGEPTGSKGTR
jgi:hypothetical protein